MQIDAKQQNTKMFIFRGKHVVAYFVCWIFSLNVIANDKPSNFGSLDKQIFSATNFLFNFQLP